MHGKRIIHCTNFNLLKRTGAYMNIASYKISHGLIRNGHNVLDFSDRDILKTFSVFGKLKQFGRKPFNELFYQYCVDTNPDGIILGHADTIMPETLARIRKALPNAKVLQWNVDCINPNYGAKNIQHIKSKIDLVDYTIITTADKKLLRQFDIKRHKVGFMPNPVDRSIETGRAFEIKDTNWDLVFPASPQSRRDFFGNIMTTKEITERISRHIGMDKVLFPRINGTNLLGGEYQTVLSDTAMGLCLNCCADYLYASDRMAHMMGNGVLALVDTRNGFQDLFGDDEIAFYKDEDELYEKIDYYRKNPEERMAIAEKGWKKYHELFNERLVAKYIADLMFDEFDAKDYPWPTIVE